VKTHRETNADATIAVLPVPRDQVSGFGIMRVDETGQVRGFVEKPKTDDQVQPLRTPAAWFQQRGIEPKGREFLASMGIYLFKRPVLIEMLNAKPLATDFGK